MKEKLAINFGKYLLGPKTPFNWKKCFSWRLGPFLKFLKWNYCAVSENVFSMSVIYFNFSHCKLSLFCEFIELGLVVALPPFGSAPALSCRNPWLVDGSDCLCIRCSVQAPSPDWGPWTCCCAALLAFCCDLGQCLLPCGPDALCWGVINRLWGCMTGLLWVVWCVEVIDWLDCVSKSPVCHCFFVFWSVLIAFLLTARAGWGHCVFAPAPCCLGPVFAAACPAACLPFLILGYAVVWFFVVPAFPAVLEPHT